MYDVNYFLDFFSKIPEEKWCAASLHNMGKSCALGHLGVTEEEILDGGIINNEKGMSLSEVLKPVSNYKEPFEIVYQINDYGNKYKENIISALEKVRDKELSEANVIEASKIVNEVEEPLNV